MATVVNENKAELRKKALRLPLQPGVYIMRSKDDTIIYIGKAKALKNRVSQYFGSDRNHEEKVRQMVLNVVRFEYIVADSEFEALILESSMIKQHKPKYNILLKDDKGYSYVRISPGDWPRMTEVKLIESDGAKYIGPYLSSYSIRDSVDSARKIFKLPTCNRKFPQDFGKGRPCLNYYIKLCMAPCRGRIAGDEYRETFQQAVHFLKGGSTASIQSLTAKMNEAAENLDFEVAAKIRDRIQAIERMKSQQKVVASRVIEQDIIALAQGEKKNAFEVFRFTDRRLSDRENFLTDDCLPESESRSEFIRQYYSIRKRIPPLIVTDGEIEDMELVEQWLTEKRGKKVKLVIPQRGEPLQLVKMCHNNAAEYLAQYTESTGREVSALDELKRLLGLEKVPMYIESYDISNLSGGENVAGMVVFENGRPLKSAYRRFKIKDVEGQDDYASMREVISRRFKEYRNFEEKKETDGFGRLPDLIFLDGGKGHVSAIKPILDHMGIAVPVFGMVKDGKHRTRAIAVSGGEIAINTTRSAFTFVSKVQDEVHRFAIGYHKQQRKKKTISSTLLTIPGVGPARAKALMGHFKTITAIKTAEIFELKAVKGVTEDVACKVYHFFRQDENK